MIRVPSFDQISVISDLHMGGPPGFQIFQQGALLAAFIQDLRANGLGDTALVINGDTVDFLADRNAKYFDPEGALDKLNDIVHADTFAPVWKALQDFVSTPHRHLVITLGNHDLELALPWVRGYLLDILSGGDAEARARITLSFEGFGFACEIGKKSVLCLHGNEVDEWNVTDYESIRRIGCSLAQGRPTDEWTPNAGTKLVIDVMNQVKKQYAFVDLLKPETEGALRIALALWPEQWPKPLQVAGIAAKRAWGKVKTRRMLSAEDLESGESANSDFRPITVANFAPRDSDSEEIFDRIEQQFLAKQDPLDAVWGQSSQLGVGDAVWSVVRGRDAYEVTRQAVKELAEGTTFRVRASDRDFERIDAIVGSTFDYVIAGHTHLARILGRRIGHGMYFNSGTWATLMELSKDQLSSVETFRPVLDQLRSAKTISQLGTLVKREPTVVTLRNREDRVEADLARVQANGDRIALESLGSQA